MRAVHEPLVRPLLLAFQEDVTTHTLDDQFLCGDAFLVVPVVRPGHTRRTVYLPQGRWYDFWTDEPVDGPAHVEVQAHLERLPVFVRAGSVVPMGPVIQYVGQKQIDRLALHVYPGPRRVTCWKAGRRRRGLVTFEVSLTRCSARGAGFFSPVL